MEEDLEKENYLLRQEVLRQEALRKNELDKAEWKAELQKGKSTEILAITLVLLFCAVVIIIGLVSSQN